MCVLYVSVYEKSLKDEGIMSHNKCNKMLEKIFCVLHFPMTLVIQFKEEHWL